LKLQTIGMTDFMLKVPRNRHEGPEGDRGIALLFLDFSARRRWVVSTTSYLLTARYVEGCTPRWRSKQTKRIHSIITEGVVTLSLGNIKLT
jgi:hypothetical protein